MLKRHVETCCVLAVGAAIGIGMAELSARVTAQSAVEESSESTDPTAEAEEDPSGESPLLTLDWMVGAWEGNTEAGSIEFSCRYTKNDAFMIRAFRVLDEVEDDEQLSGMQVIAWDPARDTLRSWTFDSDGGFGEDEWNQADDRYSMRAKYTLPDGGKGSAIHVMTYIDDDRFTWKSTNRVIDGELLPDTDQIELTRLIDEGASDPEQPADSNEGAKS